MPLLCDLNAVLSRFSLCQNCDISGDVVNDVEVTW